MPERLTLCRVLSERLKGLHCVQDHEEKYGPNPRNYGLQRVSDSELIPSNCARYLILARPSHRASGHQTGKHTGRRQVKLDKVLHCRLWHLYSPPRSRAKNCRCYGLGLLYSTRGAAWVSLQFLGGCLEPGNPALWNAICQCALCERRGDTERRWGQLWQTPGAKKIKWWGDWPAPTHAQKRPSTEIDPLASARPPMAPKETLIKQKEKYLSYPTLLIVIAIQKAIIFLIIHQNTFMLLPVDLAV